MDKPFSAQARAAITLQKELAGRFTEEGFPSNPRYIGGADIAFAKSTDGARTGSVGTPAIGIAVVYDLFEQRIVDAAYARSTVTFPYIPGLLSFREEPLLAAAIGEVRHPVDVWMFDGQGRSHPRGVGLATHMGVVHNLVTIGAAKSVLIGRYEVPPELAPKPAAARKGRTPVPLPQPVTAPLLHHGKTIATAVWTTLRTEPMIISPGHRCTREQAVATTLAATRGGQWMPEPTRFADALTKQVRDLSEEQGRQVVAQSISPAADTRDLFQGVPTPPSAERETS